MSHLYHSLSCQGLKTHCNLEALCSFLFVIHTRVKIVGAQSYTDFYIHNENFKKSSIIYNSLKSRGKKQFAVCCLFNVLNKPIACASSFVIRYCWILYMTVNNVCYTRLICLH